MSRTVSAWMHLFYFVVTVSILPIGLSFTVPSLPCCILCLGQRRARMLLLVPSSDDMMEEDLLGMSIENDASFEDASIMIPFPQSISDPSDTASLSPLSHSPHLFSEELTPYAPDAAAAAARRTMSETWEHLMGDAWNPYRSHLLADDNDYEDFMTSIRTQQRQQQQQQHLQDDDAPQQQQPQLVDPFWEQIRLEAAYAVQKESQAGPQLYQGILSQPCLLVATCTVISHEIENELIPATAIKYLFLELLTADDEYKIRMDLEAVATRSPSVGDAVEALLFHNGFHALVCYRVGHNLWQAGRTGLAYYMQSVVSRCYSADIHPACRMGHGIYVRVGAGVVIGETATVGNDVSILEGVTLGGTGKESGNRHPKVGNGVIIQDGGTVLGNIPVGDGAFVTAKSIVTKPVPPLAIVSGVPAKIQGYRELTSAAFDDDLQEHLLRKYLHQWRRIATEQAKI